MFRSNCIMKGYHKNPEATEEALADGYFKSGDLGVRHSNGYIEIKDRLKDIIISGGENISSVEIESVLYRFPGVAYAAVVAKPDEKWGETPCAFLEMKSGETATEADVIAFCRKHLAGSNVLNKLYLRKSQKHQPASCRNLCFGHSWSDLLTSIVNCLVGVYMTDTFQIAVIPGDGIGTEVTEATLAVLDAVQNALMAIIYPIQS